MAANTITVKYRIYSYTRGDYVRYGIWYKTDRWWDWQFTNYSTYASPKYYFKSEDEAVNSLLLYLRNRFATYKPGKTVFVREGSFAFERDVR